MNMVDERRQQLKRVAAKAVAYYLSNQGCIDSQCNCRCNWQRTNTAIHMQNRLAVQSKGNMVR
jgi:hypothetical protein